MSVAVDVLCELDYIDTSRLGVIGHSLGGQTSLYMTWFDKRLKVGASSCGFGTLATIIRDKINHNKALYIPGFSKYADTYDILCDIAPRAFAFTSGISDNIFPIDGVREIEERAIKKYAELGVSEKLFVHIFEGGHCFDDDAKSKIYAFIDNELSF
jgi:dienelactone hydrolase